MSSGLSLYGCSKLYSFKSIVEFRTKLTKNNIDPSKWGNYTVEYLFETEYKEKGECIFGKRDGKLLRIVRVVNVHCTLRNETGTFQIVEKSVKFEGSDAIVDRGYKHLSEIMMPDEDHLEAARRAIAEELGLKDPENEIKVEFVEENTTSPSPSKSYVGVMSQYSIYRINALIPAKFFTAEPIQEKEHGRICTFIWEQIPDETVSSSS